MSATIPGAQLKAIYELRALTLAGYMPDVLACAGCGKYDGGEFYLDPVEGRLLCADCAEKAHHITNLDNGALYALRHICLAEDKKLFGFKISPESLTGAFPHQRAVHAGAPGAWAENAWTFLKTCT